MRHGPRVTSALFFLSVYLFSFFYTARASPIAERSSMIRTPTTGEELAAIYTKAHRLFEESKFVESLGYFNAFIEAYPISVDAYLNSGVVLERLGRRTEAVERYVLVASPDHVGLTSVSYVFLGKRPEAIKSCRRALAINPNDAEYQHKLAVALIQDLQYDEAIELFRRAVKTKPDYTEAWGNLAAALTQASRYEEGLEASKETLRQAPTPKNLEGLGITLSLMGLETEAYQALHRSQEGAAMRASLSVTPPYKLVPDFFADKDLLIKVLHSSSETYGQKEPRMLPFADTSRMTRMPFIYSEHTSYLVTIPHAFIESESALVYRTGHVYTTGHGPNTKLADFFSGVLEAPPERRFDRIAAIVQQTSGNYYHFVCECLSRFLLLEPELQADPSLRLLAPMSEPFMLPLFSMLGFDISRIVPYTALDGRVYAKELLWADWQFPSPNIRERQELFSYFYAPRWTLRALRERLAQPYLPIQERSRIVYITRSDAHVRRVNGEASLIAALRERWGNDVLSFRANGTSVAEQIDVMRRARVILSPHGAGLTNMLWAAPGTAVIELPIYPHVDQCFAHMAYALDLEYWLVPEVTSMYYAQYQLNSTNIQLVVTTVSAAVQSSVCNGGICDG